MIKKNINVKVYSVSMQSNIDQFIKYITEHQLPWVNVYDGARINNTAEKYDVYSTPIIYVLDKNKVIKAKRIGASKVKDIINALELNGNNSKG